ncbi:hypothetical protein E4U21_000861 [Claviceps maximensis]|nr:hypothetical protein E4U21_000861 [Claviceps maximensis]
MGTSDDDAQSETPETLGTRIFTATAAAAAAEASSKTSVRGASVLGKRSLAEDPVPRRNARPRGVAQSVASIPTVPDRVDEESEVGEEASGAQSVQSADEPVGMGAWNSGSEEKFTAIDPEMMDQYQIMEFLLPDFKRATRELKQRLEVDDNGLNVYATILKAKQSALYRLMDIYNKPSQRSFFIDVSWLAALHKLQHAQTPQAHSVMRASVQANLVLALDFIQQALLGRPGDILSFLEALDDAFPRLFSVKAESSAQHFNMALAIRTQLFIKRLAAQTSQANAAAVISSVFCTNDDNSSSGIDYAGPEPYLSNQFKGLAGIDEIEQGSREWTQVLQRTEQLAAITSEDETHDGQEIFGEEYAMDTLLESVGQWCLERYTLLERPDEPADVGEDEFQDAQESIPDSRPESQGTIVRRPDGVEKDSGQGLRSRLPPDAPSDCSFSSRALHQSVFGSSTHFPGNRRRQDSMDDGHENAENDDDDDDFFQTDARQGNNPDQVRAQLRASKPTNMPTGTKRQALPNRQPASSLGHPSNNLSDSFHGAKFPYGGDHANEEIMMNNLRNRKAEIKHRMRTTDTVIGYNEDSAFRPKRRQKWSDKDSNTLMDLIPLTSAGWSVMEKEYGHRFEYPRDQQAYRDRARNLKVEFLLADLVLPPGFDLVLLSKKEIEKVSAARRNPLRRESDFKVENGVVKVTNTTINAQHAV